MDGYCSKNLTKVVEKWADESGLVGLNDLDSILAELPLNKRFRTWLPPAEDVVKKVMENGEGMDNKKQHVEKDVLVATMEWFYVQVTASSKIPPPKPTKKPAEKLNEQFNLGIDLEEAKQEIERNKVLVDQAREKFAQKNREIEELRKIEQEKKVQYANQMKEEEAKEEAEEEVVQPQGPPPKQPEKSHVEGEAEEEVAVHPQVPPFEVPEKSQVEVEMEDEEEREEEVVQPQVPPAKQPEKSQVEVEMEDEEEDHENDQYQNEEEQRPKESQHKSASDVSEQEHVYEDKDEQEVDESSATEERKSTVEDTRDLFPKTTPKSLAPETVAKPSILDEIKQGVKLVHVETKPIPATAEPKNFPRELKLSKAKLRPPSAEKSHIEAKQAERRTSGEHKASPRKSEERPKPLAISKETELLRRENEELRLMLAVTKLDLQKTLALLKKETIKAKALENELRKRVMAE